MKKLIMLVTCQCVGEQTTSYLSASRRDAVSASEDTKLLMADDLEMLLERNSLEVEKGEVISGGQRS